MPPSIAKVKGRVEIYLYFHPPTPYAQAFVASSRTKFAFTLPAFTQFPLAQQKQTPVLLQLFDSKSADKLLVLRQKAGLGYGRLFC